MTVRTPSAVLYRLVWDRDGGRCGCCAHTVQGQRGIDHSLHHRRPRGIGGTKDPAANSPANLILLCGTGTTGCHGQVESDRKVALDLGLLVSQFRVAAEVPVHHAGHGGWVLLTDEGLADRVLDKAAH